MIQKQNGLNKDDSSAPKPSVKKYWRSLDQLLGNPEINEVVDHDFGAAAPPPTDGLSRRRWLQLMGASMAFGAVTGCRYPDEKITPFAFRPAGRFPGIPENYSTMMEFGGIARPLMSVSYDGRPIKLDGNPDHADTLGASDTFTQATILELYDPDRSRGPARAEGGTMKPTTWDDAINTFKSLAAGSGVAVLSEPSSSPSLQRMKGEMLKANSNAKWFEFTSVSTDNSDEGSRQAFGSVHRPVYRLADAKVIVSIDADPLGIDAAGIRLSADFAKSRDADHGKMSRLYAVESDFSATGAMADHRVPVQFKQIGSFLAALEALIDAGTTTVDSSLPEKEKVLAAMASDLLKHKDQGAGVVMVGACQPASVHARAFRINSKLNSIGKTVHLHAVENAAAKSGVDQLKELTEAIESGAVTTLMILGGNPVFYAPSDLKFAETLAKVANSMHLSVYRDETSRACKWHLNAAHPLESWGDGRSYDGSVCIAQPLIEPLFDGRSALELLGTLTGYGDHSEADPEHDDHDHGDDAHNLGMMFVRETVAASLGDHPDAAWQEAVRLGFIANSESSSASPSVGAMTLEDDAESWKEEWFSGEPELIFRASKSIYDGRYANNGWLQELPEFITKLTWDNAALVNTMTAEKLGLTQGKLANFTVGDQKITLPVYVLPGLPNGTICTWLGYGRDSAGKVAGDAEFSIDSIGHDVRPLRTSGNWWSVPAVQTDPTIDKYLLATTQDHFQIDALGRAEINRRMAPEQTMIRAGSYDSYEKFLAEHGHDADHSHEEGHEGDGHEGEDHEGEEKHDDHHAHSWPGNHHLHFKNFDLTRAGWLDEKVPYKWGMSIDLNKCNGCNACVIACQSENNIPVVGKDQVSRGREMQWMRIDRYFITDEGDEEGANPKIAHQPLTCQQCEKAPCETVCPVAATTHSDEGLNDMVYNRCIGTRYCGNNCPYKVRRFNYYNYSDAQTFIKIPGADRLEKADLQLQSMMMNPEVTVRSRGVMEKCTYCVQRIQNVKILAKTEGNREIGANEITTACQDVCPSKAIVFGDIQNPESDVHKNHASPRAYTLLEELNVYPRTRYLARVTNPHPALVDTSTAEAH